ncbi:MAG: hypothetical protein CL735_05510 [Chloroflexi bacterium]|nr:hypothetical protein [Chloroflexota bacterium]|tara:strand:+ start:924 stop:1628 length:705 start_codon:yes stop_codon:yes gene_type:complete
MYRPDRALVITPHPDDAEIGCGGTVSKWISEGTKVFYVLCTNGDKGSDDPEMTSERLAKIRYQEQEDAAKVMGVSEVVHLGYPDGGLNDDAEFRGKLVHAIRKFKPEVVFSTDPMRRSFYLHRDHRMCGQVSLDAAFPFARDRLHYPEHLTEDLLETHKVADILFWGAEDIDTYIDITDSINQKITSLEKHASQVGSDIGKYLKDSSMRTASKWESKDSSVVYAEGFRRVQIRR